jgi:UDP-sugar pyrophosphorylase
MHLSLSLYIYIGWVAAVPTGVALEPGSSDYIKYEQMGLADVGACGFVLVAGGLGERLGYNGIKVELPVERTTSVKYLELYCQQILAMQKVSRVHHFRVSQG